MTDKQVTFRSGDWDYVQERCEELLTKHRAKLENPETTYRETIDARGFIRALKTILNLPQQASSAANNYK